MVDSKWQSRRKTICVAALRYKSCWLMHLCQFHLRLLLLSISSEFARQSGAHLIRVDQSVCSYRKNGVPAVASRQMFQLKVPTPSHNRHAETQLAGDEIGIDPSVTDHCGRS